MLLTLPGLPLFSLLLSNTSSGLEWNVSHYSRHLGVSSTTFWYTIFIVFQCAIYIMVLLVRRFSDHLSLPFRSPVFLVGSSTRDSIITMERETQIYSCQRLLGPHQRESNPEPEIYRPSTPVFPGPDPSSLAIKNTPTFVTTSLPLVEKGFWSVGRPSYFNFRSRDRRGP